mmetsp:Transcript_44599/g.129059  ORF Transcript_44599/g.129059 Transcript_44599/m.129059 type:complete len:498 (+) Transcript_44599:99-1592(+)
MASALRIVIDQLLKQDEINAATGFLLFAEKGELPGPFIGGALEANVVCEGTHLLLVEQAVVVQVARLENRPDELEPHGVLLAGDLHDVPVHLAHALQHGPEVPVAAVAAALGAVVHEGLQHRQVDTHGRIRPVVDAHAQVLLGPLVRGALEAHVRRNVLHLLSVEVAVAVEVAGVERGPDDARPARGARIQASLQLQLLQDRLQLRVGVAPGAAVVDDLYELGRVQTLAGFSLAPRADESVLLAPLVRAALEAGGHREGPHLVLVQELVLVLIAQVEDRPDDRRPRDRRQRHPGAAVASSTVPTAAEEAAGIHLPDYGRKLHVAAVTATLGRVVHQLGEGPDVQTLGRGDRYLGAEHGKLLSPSLRIAVKARVAGKVPHLRAAEPVVAVLVAGLEDSGNEGAARGDLAGVGVELLEHVFQLGVGAVAARVRPVVDELLKELGVDALRGVGVPLLAEERELLCPFLVVALEADQAGKSLHLFHVQVPIAVGVQCLEQA